MDELTRLWLVSDEEICVMPEDQTDCQFVTGDLLAEKYHTASPEQRQQWKEDLLTMSRVIASSLWNFHCTDLAVEELVR